MGTNISILSLSQFQVIGSRFLIPRNWFLIPGHWFLIIDSWTNTEPLRNVLKFGSYVVIVIELWNSEIRNWQLKIGINKILDSTLWNLFLNQFLILNSKIGTWFLPYLRPSRRNLYWNWLPRDSRLLKQVKSELTQH